MSAGSAAEALEPCPHCGADHGEDALRCPATDMVLPLRGRLLAGKFHLLAELGRGGMGAVWRARNIHVDREVALKLILPDLPRHPEIVARFQDEARVAARVGHAGICDILDFVQTPLGPVIVMELLRGESLAQRIERAGPLPVPVAVGIVRQALVALDAAHRAGVIHRDLKPENLFLHQPDAGTMVVKLMDFGISKLIDRAAALTGSGAVLGTPEYMAPEQLGGAAGADARTDLWAIGAVLYKALTGVDAFAAASVVEILMAVAAAEPAPPESHVPALPRELSAIILRCLSRDPAGRFQSATELHEALRPFAEPARPPPDPEAIALLPTLALTAADATAPTSGPLRVPPVRASARWPRWLAGLGLLGACGLALWWWYPTASDSDATPPAAPPGLAAAVPPVSAAPDAEPPVRDAPPALAEPPAAVAQPSVPESPVSEPPVAEPPASEPPVADGLIVAGELVTPAVAGKPGTQRWAKEYCAALARNSFLGRTRWKLANPREARSFTGVAGLRAGGYWTTANHRGVGLVVWLPKGSDSSLRASKTSPRPLCVAPRP